MLAVFLGYVWYSLSSSIPVALIRFTNFFYNPLWNRWWSLQSDWLSALWFIPESHYFLFLNHLCSKSRHSFSTCKLTSCLIKSHLFALYCIISVLGTKILRCESLFVSALRWESLFVSTGSNKYWYWLNSMISKWL